jgi:hypothetical protein
MTPGSSWAALENDGESMDEQELKYPDWQIPLRDLFLEFDPEKLPGKIQKVETLIFERLNQLGLDGDGRSEKVALMDGLNILRMIKRDKLGDQALQLQMK